jgi:hypothetical protein
MNRSPKPRLHDLFIGEDLTTPSSPLANPSQHYDDLSIEGVPHV